MHANGIVHRDLKAENILFDKDFNMKLCDFGFAREFNDVTRTQMSKSLGTEGYMAPELDSSNTKYDGVKVDSFALGVLLFLFSFGRPPFFNATPEDPFYKHFYTGDYDAFWAIYEEKLNEGKKIEKELKDLIQALLQVDPKKRPEPQQIFDYEWMKEGSTLKSQDLLEKMVNLRANVKKGMATQE
jgi:serine/threonine protein kinase